MSVVKVVGFGLWLVPASFGQEPGKLVIPLVRSVTILVESEVAESCGGAISQSVLKQDATTLLRGVGFTVSNIHSSRLEISTDCVAADRRSHTPAMAIDQCLSLSETLPDRSTQSGAMVATTWRKCQSNRCVGPNCEDLVRSGLHSQLIELLSSFQKHDSLSALAPPQTKPQQQAGVTVEEAARHVKLRPFSASYSTGYAPIPRRMLIRNAFYLLYVMNCLGLMVYWQFRQWQF